MWAVAVTLFKKYIFVYKGNLLALTQAHDYMYRSLLKMYLLQFIFTCTKANVMFPHRQH